MKNDKVIIGLLAGLALGAVIGLMLAPDKGSETRKKVMKEGEDLAENLKDKFEGFLNDLGLGSKSKGSSDTDNA